MKTIEIEGPWLAKITCTACGKRIKYASQATVVVTKWPEGHSIGQHYHHDCINQKAQAALAQQALSQL